MGNSAFYLLGLAQDGATVGFVDGNLGHGEVGLTQLHTLGVDADEDLGDGLDVQVEGQLDEADLVTGDAAPQVCDGASRVVNKNSLG